LLLISKGASTHFQGEKSKDYHWSSLIWQKAWLRDNEFTERNLRLSDWGTDIFRK